MIERIRVISRSTIWLRKIEIFIWISAKGTCTSFNSIFWIFAAMNTFDCCGKQYAINRCSNVDLISVQRNAWPSLCSCFYCTVRWIILYEAHPAHILCYSKRWNSILICTSRYIICVAQINNTRNKMNLTRRGRWNIFNGLLWRRIEAFIAARCSLCLTLDLIVVFLRFRNNKMKFKNKQQSWPYKTAKITSNVELCAKWFVCRC